MTKSLKRQLLFWLIVPLAVIVPTLAALQYWLTLEPASVELDHQLGDTAAALSKLVRTKGGTVRLEMTPETEESLRTDERDTVIYAIIDSSHQLVAGDIMLHFNAPPLRPGGIEYLDIRIGDQSQRMVRRAFACGEQVCEARVAETLAKRSHVRWHALVATVLSMVLLSGAAIASIMFAVRRGLQPLTGLRGQLAQRSLDDLRPLEGVQAPAEVQPLVTAINQLLDRLQRASSAQKAFLADAAHQLRTPLATLRTETELALIEPHAQSLHATLQHLHLSAGRAAHLADQLLALARADPDAQVAADFTNVDLKEVATAAAQEWSSRAFAADIDLGFDLAPVRVLGQFRLLKELLSNLIHNAIEYGGRGARVTVRTYLAAAVPVLEVEDDGPGIPLEDRPRMIERFHRGRNANGQGSGLGLAIVTDVARIHGAVPALLTGENGKGLLVRIAFPQSALTEGAHLPRISVVPR